MARRVVAVFGGSGFIGRHLVRRLAADDWIVRVGVRDPEAASFLKPMGDAGQIVPVAADISEKESLPAVVADADAVINLVGILFERGRRTFHRVHVEGAANVAASAAAAGVKRLVHMSAIGANPDSPAEYARTKAKGESAVSEAFDGASIVRASVVFGPEDDFFNRFADMARFAPALPVFPTRFQPVFVGDVAEAIERILNDPETCGKCYELGGPRVMTFREVLELVLSETRRKRLLLPIPLSIAYVQALVLENMPKPPLTRDQLKLLEVDNVVAANALTLKDLGIEPTAAEAIVPTYLRRFRTPSQRTP